MSYQVTARKWRPQTFEDVVGQSMVTRTLQNAIKSNRIAHAFLFSGVRGVGKTTTARVLAKALNCINGPTPEPCGECDSCQEITASGSVDVLEIDAASNTGVDSIRELRESVKYGTARDRFKVFIIDEVHMLSNAAFNALLKTLEEPPAHVKFILATTEHHKIPVTITSRCQQYEFKPIAFNLILERLRLIAQKDGIEIGDLALRAIAASAQGSMRDAQSALDQIVAFSGNTVEDEDVRALLGVVDLELVSSLVDAVLGQDRQSLLEQMRTLEESGISPQNFCRKLIEYIRNLMVCRVAGWDQRLLHLADSDKDVVERQAAQFSEIDLIRFYDVLNKTENELRWHAHPHVHLELNLLKLVELTRLARLEDVISGLQGTGGGLPSGLPQTPKSSVPKGSQAATRSVPKAKPVNGADRGELRMTQANSSGPVLTPPGASDGDVVSRLRTILHDRHYPLYEQFQLASQAVYNSGCLTLRFPASQNIHAAHLKDPDRLGKLAAACAGIVGLDVKIEVLLEEHSQESKPSDPRENPNVKIFLDTFNGQVIVDREFEE